MTGLVYDINSKSNQQFNYGRKLTQECLKTIEGGGVEMPYIPLIGTSARPSKYL